MSLFFKLFLKNMLKMSIFYGIGIFLSSSLSAFDISTTTMIWWGFGYVVLILLLILPVSLFETKWEKQDEILMKTIKDRRDETLRKMKG